MKHNLWMGKNLLGQKGQSGQYGTGANMRMGGLYKRFSISLCQKNSLEMLPKAKGGGGENSKF